MPGVSTGTRIVRMVRNHEIPRNATIDGVKCRVWYKDLLLKLTSLWHLLMSWRPLSCLRPPSVLDEMVVAPSVEVEEVPASFQAASEMSGGGMNVASLDLWDNELDSSLFHGGRGTYVLVRLYLPRRIQSFLRV